MRNSKTVYEYNVIDLFELQVIQTPQHMAVHDGAKYYTYNELNEQANQLAHCLKKHKVMPGEFVGIILKPGIDFIVSILAIIKIGGVYLPLDALAPQRRLVELLDDAKPKMVISNEEYKDLISENAIQVHLIRDLNAESSSYPRINLQRIGGVSSPLYIMYTSGSTGKPKGVVVPHQAVAHLVKVQNDFQLQAGGCIAQFSNLAFDASPFEIWSALLNGAHLHIIPLEIRTDPAKLKKFLEANEIHYLFLPTGFLHQLIKSAADTLDKVRVIVFGGEQANAILLKKFLLYRKEKKLAIELINGYGPTETTAYTCRKRINEQSVLHDEQLASIGTPIDNVMMYVLDENHQNVAEGELYVSGINLAIGYHNSDQQNQEKFIANPFCQDEPYRRLYKTGDQVRKLPSGEYLFLGRFDDQVKIGGFRIHLHEIEEQLMRYPAIALAAVTIEIGGGSHKMLTAYIVLSSQEEVVNADEIRSFLSELLPPYMLPAKYVMVNRLPLTLAGKVDKSKLDTIPHTDLSFHMDTSASSATEEKVKKVWQYLLNRKVIDTNKNLFELGANSLLITEACAKINQELQSTLQVADIFSHPTIHKLSRYLEGDVHVPLVKRIKKIDAHDVAIIGMACRFPGANSLQEYWDNLCQGKESLQQFSAEQLADSPNKKQFAERNFVPVKGILANIDQFDANFFGFNPGDAHIADPQQRIFLECAWEALEHAGIAPNKLEAKTISVFAGMSDSTYLQENLLKNGWFRKEHNLLQQRIACSTGMLSTQVSYRLNLKGRSLNVNTACSTGLITVEQACQDLILGQSDIALAGAASIVVPQVDGYCYQNGNIVSPDGHCRPFSETANGTVFSNGVGVVILKRLADAIADQDTIYAVINGRGVNNDGSDKLGFTAPSTSGQMSCVREALERAMIRAEDVGYLEAHGTATALGDVVEIGALTAVYREQTEKKQFCFLGSVKANIGHTEVTAGIAGLIKTALCLHYQKIPPLINFTKANPNLFLNQSPFMINQHLIHWPVKAEKRYAGVSAFGIGGTNIHMILSEYVHKPTWHASDKEQLIVLSAKTEKALEQNIHNLLHYLLPQEKTIELADVAYTLQTGREDFPWRCFGVGKTVGELIRSLAEKTIKFCNENIHQNVVFMFPGQGVQYYLMAMELMEKIPFFAALIEQGVRLAQKELHTDLLAMIRNPEDERLNQTQYAQPALFIIEYALAQLLMHWGVKPDALIGHDLGEYVAACLAGVFSFAEAITLVCGRGFLMAKAASQPGMLTMEQSFKDMFTAINLSAPAIPIVSSLTGTWLSAEEATTSGYWHRHMCDAVKIDAGLHTLISDAHSFFVEVGPGQSISTLLQERIRVENKTTHMIQILPGDPNKNEYYHLISAFGALWQSGISIDWHRNYENERRRRIPLPTYAFQRQRYWVEPDDKAINFNSSESVYKPVWSHQVAYRDMLPIDLPKIAQPSWILFKDQGVIGDHLLRFLQEYGIQPIIVESGTEYVEHNSFHFQICSSEKDHYFSLIKKIKNKIHEPVILHLYSCDNTQSGILASNLIEQQLELSFYSILYLTQAYIEHIGDQTPLKCAVISTGIQRVVGTEIIIPPNASLIGPCRVITQEHNALKFRLLDINLEELAFYNRPLLSHIIHSCLSEQWESQQPIMTYRNGYCWELAYQEIKTGEKRTRFKDGGVYVLTGGLGGIALSLCEAIAKQVTGPRFILLSRSPVISESEWNKIIQNVSHKSYEKVKRLQSLKDLGASLFCHQVDVTELEPLSSIIHYYKRYFGAIDGVIHAAGIAGSGLVQLKAKHMSDAVFMPKIQGTYNLVQALHDVPLEFVALMSSIAALTGEKGQVDYCAANACLDAFATTHLFPAKMVVSLNWNTWRDVGMTVETQRPDDLDYFARGNDITSGQGQQLFLQVMEHNISNAVISNYEPLEYMNMLQKNHDCAVTPQVKQRSNLNTTDHYHPPQNSIEEKLAPIWQDSLGIELVGMNDDFFALGGHSLRALNLIEKINKTFGSAISVQHLYQAPTIRQLSARISSDLDDKQLDIVVPLKITKARPPYIFFCHPASGLIYCFNQLASQWQLPISIYGLQDPSVSAGVMLYESINAIAESYLSAIRQIQPQGPYFLVGYSFGGMVLYEVARLLRQQGESIGLLALIESWAIFSQQQMNDHYFREIFCATHKGLSGDLIDLACARMRLLLAHKPAVMEQDILLFKAKELSNDYKAIDHPTNGWSKFSSGMIHCHTLEGNHETILSNENCFMIQQWISNFIE